MSDKLYVVFCGNHIPAYAPERNLSDMTWDGTVKDIADLQFPSLSRVIEIGTGRDVTKDMLKQVADLWAVRGDALTRRQFEMLELHCGTQFARTFQMEDA